MATIAKTTGANPEELKHLETGQYHIKAGILESVKVDGTSPLADHRHGMSAEQWETVKAEQIAKFYQKTTDSPEGLQVVEKAEKERSLN